MGEKEMILVIGGGVAGLAAAGKLARAGWRVTVLEARERLGGRIFTVQSGGVPVELGAEFIHGPDETLWERIRAGELKTLKVPDRNRMLVDGALRPVALWNEVGRAFEKIDMRRLDQSFADFLATQGLPEDVKQMATGFVEGFDAANTTKIGAHALKSSGWGPEENPGAEQFRIARGYSALVDFLASQLVSPTVEMKTRTVVRSVRWEPGRVEVQAEQNGERVTFRARAAIVTLPLGVLKSGSVVFDPPLIEKARAIEGLEFGNVVKVVLQFRRAIWSEANFGFVHAFSEAIPTWWSDERGPVLTGWTGGPKADALSRWTEDRLVEEALEIVSRSLGVSVDALRAELSRVHRHDWLADPFSRGAYSYIPVNGLELPKVLAAPVADTLFFAGEATASDVEPGTVHGALASGMRAAQEIKK